MDKKINPSILSLSGLLAIILLAAASDRLVVSLRISALTSPEAGAYDLFQWAQSLQVLFFAIVFVLYSRFVFSLTNLSRLVAYVFIIIRLVVAFYPQI